MEKYLIAVDLDGTIIPHLYDVSNYTINVLHALDNQGHKVIITTGRPFRSSFFVYYKAGLSTPMINYNGQLITNPRDLSYKRFTDYLNLEELLDVYNHEKDNYTLFFSESYDRIYSNKDDKDVYELMHHNMLSSLYVGDLNELLENKVHGTLILAKEGKGKEIQDYINNHHKHLAARVWEWGKYKEIVEIYSLNTNKGLALKKVMNDLGFDKEHTICCVDSLNDFEIANESGEVVVPKNAHEDIKKIASVVLSESCEEDAIANYFNNKFNLGVKKL